MSRKISSGERKIILARGLTIITGCVIVVLDMHKSNHPLRKYRKANGLTLRALGKKAKISDSILSRIENGQINPSWSLARRLVKATDGAVTADDFMRAA
jgi:predicted transcriptional regulator